MRSSQAIRPLSSRPQVGRRRGGGSHLGCPPFSQTPAVTRASQPNKIDVQVVQKEDVDVEEVLAASEVLQPVEKPRRRGRPRKVRPEDLVDVMDASSEGCDAQTVASTSALASTASSSPSRSGSTNENSDESAATRKERSPRKSFSTFVKELFDAQASSQGKKKTDVGEDQGPTELIFKLTRRGYGWGEEIIPQLTVERRPVKGAASARRKKTGDMVVRDDDDEEDAREEGGEENSAMSVIESRDDDGSPSTSATPETVLNAYLIDIGVPEQDVERLVNSAVAWRMTPGGRPLIDRRRQSRLTRNVKIVTKYLVDKCGVPLGKNGVASVFMRTPELMLCKPSNNDRWDRRAVELAAFLLKNGHCNVPEVYAENQELGMWVKRQRVTRAAGQLSQERLTILERMGFEFGDLAQVTEEWETRFDMLVDWVLWHGESGDTFSWDLINWGKKGGITARELALWISLQREFFRRQLLPAEAVQRFEAVYSGWRDTGASVEEERWMRWLGRLVYVIERRRLAMRGPPTGRGNPFASKRVGSIGVAGSMSGNGVSPAKDDSPQDSRASVARKQVVNTVSSRREAAAGSPLSEDPGLRFWLSRQRWMWRKSILDPERVKMLQLAGIDMDIYPADHWRRMAHLAAECLQGARIELPFGSNGENCELEGVTPRDADRVDAEPMTAGLGNTRLQVLRWVETQRALFVDGRMSPGQMRYLTFLGLTWVLSEKVVHADDSIWLSKWKSLRAHLGSRSGASLAPSPVSSALSSAADVSSAMSFELQDWIAQQRALCYLGLLDEARQSKLSSLGVDLGVTSPSEEERVWNERLSELFVHTQEIGHADVSQTERPDLWAWLEALKDGSGESLSPTKVAQLKSLGVKLG